MYVYDMMKEDWKMLRSREGWGNLVAWMLSYISALVTSLTIRNLHDCPVAV